METTKRGYFWHNTLQVEWNGNWEMWKDLIDRDWPFAFYVYFTALNKIENAQVTWDELHFCNMILFVVRDNSSSKDRKAVGEFHMTVSCEWNLKH